MFGEWISVAHTGGKISNFMNITLDKANCQTIYVKLKHHDGLAVKNEEAGTTQPTKSSFCSTIKVAHDFSEGTPKYSTMPSSTVPFCLNPLPEVFCF